MLFDVEEEEEKKIEPKYFEKQEIKLPMIDGIDWSYGLMHLPIKALLLDMVVDFGKVIHVEADALNEIYLGMKEDIMLLDQYRIRVHSMESSANFIGATVLGGMAKILENAARDGDIERIDVLHDIFLQFLLS